MRVVDDMHQAISASRKNIVYIIRYIPEFVLETFYELEQHEHVKHMRNLHGSH